MSVLKIEKLKKGFESGSNKLFNNKDRIDALNVFPVPDGDTGTNMSSSFQSAIKKIKKINFKDVGSYISELSKNILMFARGNSGVILSQIIKGLAEVWKNKKELIANDIIDGFASASKTAYKSVLKPVEGTILTVIRETSEELKKMKLNNKTKIKDIFANMVKIAKKSVNNTPNLLPVLKEVGVVDSGGEGLLMIIEGISSFLNGKFIDKDLESTKPFSVIDNTEVYTGEFGYCTELIIKLEEVEKFNKEKFVEKLENLGNSMVVVNDDDILKIHIHTVTPGKILNIGQKFGEFLTVKIENMTQQANNTKSNIEGVKKFEQNLPEKENAIISCNAGSGFIEMMKEYGCDFVIEGGQTNNPSTQDIVEAIEYVNAKNIIILPNNSNIILAAQQASKLKSDKNICIIPTKSQAQGVAAIMNYSSELNIKENKKEIESCLKNLLYGDIVKAVKDTKINNVKVKKDHYLVMLKNELIETQKTLFAASKKLIDKMMKSKKRAELLVIYYGNNLTENDAKKLEKYALEKYGDIIEVQVQNGDQYIYDYIFSLE